MSETREILDLTAYAMSLCVSVDRLKKEMLLDTPRYELENTRDACGPKFPHATVGGRPYMFWGTASSFVRKELLE
jgi:hypothetical protein